MEGKGNYLQNSCWDRTLETKQEEKKRTFCDYNQINTSSWERSLIFRIMSGINWIQPLSHYAWKDNQGIKRRLLEFSKCGLPDGTFLKLPEIIESTKKADQKIKRLD